MAVGEVYVIMYENAEPIVSYVYTLGFHLVKNRLTYYV